MRTITLPVTVVIVTAFSEARVPLSSPTYLSLPCRQPPRRPIKSASPTPTNMSTRTWTRKPLVAITRPHRPRKDSNRPRQNNTSSRQTSRSSCIDESSFSNLKTLSSPLLDPYYPRNFVSADSFFFFPPFLLHLFCVTVRGRFHSWNNISDNKLLAKFLEKGLPKDIISVRRMNSIENICVIAHTSFQLPAITQEFPRFSSGCAISVSLFNVLPAWCNFRVYHGSVFRTCICAFVNLRMCQLQYELLLVGYMKISLA